MKQRAAKWVFRLGVGLFLLSLASCGGPRYTLPGNWQFTFTSTMFPGNVVTGTAPLQQTGVNVTGTITFATNPLNCAPTGAVTGTVSGTGVTLNVQQGTHPQSVLGIFNTTITSMQGGYTGGCISTDVGSWAATKT